MKGEGEGKKRENTNKMAHCVKTLSTRPDNLNSVLGTERMEAENQHLLIVLWHLHVCTHIYTHAHTHTYKHTCTYIHAQIHTLAH